MKRRWELMIWTDRFYWRYHIDKPFGGPGRCRETWIGPFCFRVWSKPQYVSSVSRPIQLVRGI